MQVSYGQIHRPEALEPETDVARVTASIAYHLDWGENNWQTTLAWGRNNHQPGETLDALLLESLVNFHGTHTLFGRAEYVEKDHLFPPGNPLAEASFRVGKVSAGYIYDFAAWRRIKFGVGGLGSFHFVPDRLQSTYGNRPLSFMLFTRAKF